jgi:vacuolar-type H+-ATPase subunit H
MGKADGEVLELARKILSESNLYIWDTALKEAERILENRKKMKAVNSYYSKYY